MGKFTIVLIVFVSALLINCNKAEPVLISNPIYDGYYADPSIVYHQDTFYIYATIDPWGGEELGVLASADFQTWEVKHINWPTKKACATPVSSSANVWAPSVVKANNGNFYMYVSVGSEVWVGMSKHPLGPWKNAKADNSPLISRDLFPNYHMIDAECFIDTDNQVYLYWGSGWDWVNGHCFVVKLKDDMITFDGEIKDITPPNYFEGPYMLKHDSKYYLMYSDGKVIDTTYKVRYAVSDTPLGPWTEGKNSPVLSTGSDENTVSPGHHTVFEENGQHYILYHRHSKITNIGTVEILRELCVDSLKFSSDGSIQKIIPRGIYSFHN